LYQHNIERVVVLEKFVLKLCEVYLCRESFLQLMDLGKEN